MKISPALQNEYKLKKELFGRLCKPEEDFCVIFCLFFKKGLNIYIYI